MEPDSKNGFRGRPKAFDDALLEEMMAEHGPGRRQAQNRLYASQALANIGRLRREGITVPDWLIEDQKGKTRWSLLAELGRFEYFVKRGVSIRLFTSNLQCKHSRTATALAL